MRLFITGITGVLGRHVAELCVKEGHEVVALVRNKTISNSDFPFNVEVCCGDITDLGFLPENLYGAEVIINCAADTNMISVYNEQQAEINVTGIKNLIAAAKKANIKKFIHVSSASTIAHGDEAHPTDESIKLTTADFRLPYINTKIIGEELLLREFKTNNFPVIILNPTFMLGPNDLNKSSGKLILSAINKKVLLYPLGGKNIVDVRDVAQAAINAISMGKVGNNYLLSNTNLTYKEVFALACGYANVPAPKHKMPYLIGTIIGFLGTCYERIAKKSLSINTKTIQIAYENHYYKADKAKRDLNFTPRSVEETIKDTVDWYKANQ